MSIKRMTTVWDESAHTGSDLLLLLAFADSANDEGCCWPSIDNLCKKTRLSQSTVIRRTKTLENSGELVVKRSRRYGNKYIVATGFTEDALHESIKKHFGEKFLTVILQDNSNCQIDSSELASCDSSQLSQMTDDPSIESSTTKDSGTSGDVPGTAEPVPGDPPTPTFEPSNRVTWIKVGAGEIAAVVVRKTTHKVTIDHLHPDYPKIVRVSVSPANVMPRAEDADVDRFLASGGAWQPERKPDPVFDTVAERLFFAKPGDPALGELGGVIGKIRKSLANIGCTLKEFNAACDYYQREGLHMPRKSETAVTMIQDWRAERDGTNPTDRPTKIITADGEIDAGEHQRRLEATRRRYG